MLYILCGDLVGLRLRSMVSDMIQCARERERERFLPIPAASRPPKAPASVVDEKKNEYRFCASLLYFSVYGYVGLCSLNTYALEYQHDNK